jgi:hypothetical protein
VSRYFTPDEANAALEEVRPLVEEMVELRRAQVEAQERKEALGARIAGNGHGIEPGEPARATEEIERVVGDLAECVDRLNDLGVQVKDLDTGLIDFPALREGEEVLLCWRLGEESVVWWHRVEDGFAGRRPLPF